uniref:DUF4780 domain-containing protein n=1 Tax=Strongyloides venezuelensis TaxID=75913 RepID=A0A0K0FRM0_STRVS
MKFPLKEFKVDKEKIRQIYIVLKTLDPLLRENSAILLAIDSLPFYTPSINNLRKRCAQLIIISASQSKLTKKIDQAQRLAAIIQIADEGEKNITEVEKMMNAWNSLKTYDVGKGKPIDHWLKKLECCFEIDSVTEDLKKIAVIKLKSTKEVMDYIESLPEVDRRSYPTVVALLKQKYDGSVSVQNAQAQLRCFRLDMREEHFLESCMKLGELVKTAYDYFGENDMLRAYNCSQKSSRDVEAKEPRQRITFNSNDRQLQKVDYDKIEEQNKLLMDALIRKES